VPSASISIASEHAGRCRICLCEREAHAASACKAAATPAFSLHDLRHRRATLWHLGGVPAAQAAGWLGHSAHEHLRTYAHVMIDRTELDYSKFLEHERSIRPRT
jgi:integrase